MVASKKIYDHTPVDESMNSNHGHSLLSFMNLASNKVKTALEKPNTFKRNINHRRFLQKQFRAMVKSPEKTPGRRTIPRENIDSLNFTIRDCGGQTFPPPLSHNFVQFDALDASIPNLAYEAKHSYAPFARSESYGQELCVKKQLRCNAYERIPTASESNCLYQNREYPSSLPELVEEEEDFLTGEELTQAIELKDLFIPETDLTQYLLNSKEHPSAFHNLHDLSMENYLCRDFGVHEDILAF